MLYPAGFRITMKDGLRQSFKDPVLAKRFVLVSKSANERQPYSEQEAGLILGIITDETGFSKNISLHVY